jgi:predicted Zn-dependent protease
LINEPIELLYYLEQYTTAKAKEVIKGCLQSKTESSYLEPRALLRKHFGDSFKIANAYVTKLSSWTPIKPNEGEKFQEFAIVLEQARTAMTGMDYIGDSNTAHFTRQLWEKLPRYLHTKWCERANAIRVAQGRMAGFEDFVQFVTKQADLATDPVYSEELVTKESSKSTRRDHRNKG